MKTETDLRKWGWTENTEIGLNLKKEDISPVDTGRESIKYGCRYRRLQQTEAKCLHFLSERSVKVNAKIQG